MQVSEAITIVSTISEGIKEAKEACNEIPIGLFKPTRKKVIELQKQIEFLENHIRIGFPKLKDVIIL